MALTNTALANMSLNEIGAGSLTDLDTDTTVEAEKCRLYFEQTREELLREIEPNFARTRATLTEDASTPEFGWDYQYILPADFLKLQTGYEPDYEYELEGNLFLTDDSTAEIIYIKEVTDPTKWDSLFVNAFVLTLAQKLAGAIAGTANNITEKIEMRLKTAMAKAKGSTKSEDPKSKGYSGWNNARFGSGIV